MNSSFFGDQYIEAYRPKGEQSRSILLFLHGFPGNLTKNEDIAVALSSALNLDAVLPHYRGLGKSVGSVSLASTISDSLKILDWLTTVQGYHSVHLIGHSWGGLVGLNLLRAAPKKIASLSLLAPLSVLPSQDEFGYMINDFFMQKGQSCASLETSQLLAEAEFLRKNHSPLDFAADLSSTSTPILAVSAKHDDVVPTATVKHLAMQLGANTRLYEMSDDHYFTGSRQKITDLIYAHIAETKSV